MAIRWKFFAKKNDLSEKVMGIVTDNTPPDEPKRDRKQYAVHDLFSFSCKRVKEILSRKDSKRQV